MVLYSGKITKCVTVQMPRLLSLITYIPKPFQNPPQLFAVLVLFLSPETNSFIMDLIQTSLNHIGLAKIHLPNSDEYSCEL